MSRIVYFLLGVAAFTGVIGLLLHSELGRHVFSGFKVLTRSGEIQRISQAYGDKYRLDMERSGRQNELSDRMHALMREKSEAYRQLGDLEDRLDNDVDSAVEQMRKDMQRVRDFYAQSGSGAEVSAELAKADNLWQAATEMWSSQKEKGASKDYKGVLFGMQDVQNSLNDIAARELPNAESVSDQTLDELFRYEAERKLLIEQLKDRNTRLQAVAAEVKDRISVQQAALREKIMQQQNRSREDQTQARSQDRQRRAVEEQERVMERNRSQQEIARERQQQMRERMAK